MQSEGGFAMRGNGVATADGLLQSLIDKVSTVFIFRCDANEYRLTAVFCERPRQVRSVTRDNLKAALLALLDEEPLKYCPQCRQHKPHSAFPRDRSRKDDRNSYCLVCNRQRHKKTG
jgi:hypothetical protein